MINWPLIEKLHSLTTQNSVVDIAKQWADENGFEGFGIAAKFNRVVESSGAPNLIRSHNYTSDLSKLYAALGNPSHDKNDPVVQAAILGMPTLSYDSSLNTNMPFLLDIIPDSRKQIKFASECGVRTGIISPFKLRNATWGFLNLSSSSDFSKEELDYQVAHTSHFSQAIASTLERVLFDSQVMKTLSMRECEVLRWAAIGKTSWEISVILMISERTVNFHFAEAARKLGVKGRRAACTAAMALGLIKFS